MLQAAIRTAYQLSAIDYVPKEGHGRFVLSEQGGS